MILDSPFVKLAVVIDRSEFSAFLLDKEEWCCVWALRWSYVSFGFLFLDMLFKGFIFQLRKRVDSSSDRCWGIGLQFNGMVPWAIWW